MYVAVYLHKKSCKTNLFTVEKPLSPEEENKEDYGGEYEEGYLLKIKS